MRTRENEKMKVQRNCANTGKIHMNFTTFGIVRNDSFREDI